MKISKDEKAIIRYAAENYSHVLPLRREIDFNEFANQIALNYNTLTPINKQVYKTLKTFNGSITIFPGNTRVKFSQS